jgi:hypothetical protein
MFIKSTLEESSTVSCYCDRVHLPVIQSSNERHVVEGPLLLGVNHRVQIIAAKSRCPSLLDGAGCQSPNVAMGMNHGAIPYQPLKKI